MSNCNTTICRSSHSEVDKLNVLIISKEKAMEEKLTSLLQLGGVNRIETTDQLGYLDNTTDELTPDIVFVHTKDFEDHNALLSELIGRLKQISYTILIGESGNLALEFGTVGYLDKPLDFRKLERHISRFLFNRKLEKYGDVLNRLNSSVCPVKLKFSTRTGHVFIDPEEIIYFKADSNYTHIFLSDKKHITVAKSLRNFDVGLENIFFTRISRSVIVNRKYLIELDRNNKMCLLKHKDQEYKLAVSKSHVKSLLDNYLNC